MNEATNCSDFRLLYLDALWDVAQVESPRQEEWATLKLRGRLYHGREWEWLTAKDLADLRRVLHALDRIS